MRGALLSCFLGSLSVWHRVCEERGRRKKEPYRIRRLTMSDKKCLDCSQRQNCEDSLASWVFFIIRLVATVAVRVVTVLIDIHPLYGKISWYIGIGGFLLFFIYKFNVNRSLAKTIDKENLIYKCFVY